MQIITPPQDGEEVGSEKVEGGAGVVGVGGVEKEDKDKPSSNSNNNNNNTNNSSMNEKDKAEKLGLNSTDNDFTGLKKTSNVTSESFPASMNSRYKTRIHTIDFLT